MRPDPISLLAELVAIDSENPGLAEGGAGEGGMAEFCAGGFVSQGRRRRPKGLALTRDIDRAIRYEGRRRSGPIGPAPVLVEFLRGFIA